MIKRNLETLIQSYLKRKKAVIILGARQVGKTTLLNSMFAPGPGVLWLNADESGTRAIFENLSAASFKSYLGKHKTVIIDEAQRIENIGLKLKILQDAYGKEIQFIATGSSSFDLANKINEPMTGRKWEFKMYPLTFTEMAEHHGLLAERNLLETRLLYGYYPDVVQNPGSEGEILSGLVNDNLYRDVFKWQEIRKPVQFENLAKALAYQIGSQVSMAELGVIAGLDKNTAEKYVRLLEQSFIIFRLGSFSRNLRNELKASSKFYFYDLGIRNALIGDFSPALARQDIGHLFENLVIAEFIKHRDPFAVGAPGYFWRTTAGQEIDFLTDGGGKLSAYEIKWNPKIRAAFPRTFTEHYQPAVQAILHRDNFFECFPLPQPD
jgi:predicted AAA+ superfamily ATPase